MHVNKVNVVLELSYTAVKLWFHYSEQNVPPNSLADILNGLKKNLNAESQVQFLVRRECVLEDTLRTVMRPNFCVSDLAVVSYTMIYTTFT